MALAFGSLLRRYRLAAGLTQEELAERAHISKRSLSDMERGVPHRPRKDTLALLADALALAPPDRAVLADAAQHLGPAPAAAPAPASTSPLVGRAAELVLLGRHLAGEGPPLLLLAGEPGIGKTRLLRAAIPRALGAGLRVLEGGCQRHGGQDPSSTRRPAPPLPVARGAAGLRLAGAALARAGTWPHRAAAGLDAAAGAGAAADG